jgi:ferritin-like metal-binding protein YciE
MGFFSKDIETMDDLFVHTLRDIYYAEQQILQALPKMIEKTTNPQLRAGFEHHLAETRNHVRRVERVFEMHGVRLAVQPSMGLSQRPTKWPARSMTNKFSTRLIAAAQAVEHYEMTRYGALISWASSGATPVQVSSTKTSRKRRRQIRS